MDAQRFDRLTRSLSEAGTRRGLIGLLATLPVCGGLLALLDSDETDAKGRRRRRKKRHKHGKGRHKGKRHKKTCKPKSLAKTCAGTCGFVKNTCKKTVDCGSCACDPPCGECFVCNEATGVCEPDPTQQGGACGDPGQVCQADGSCACDASSCRNPTPICAADACIACGGASDCTAAGAGDLCCSGSCFTKGLCASGEGPEDEGDRPLGVLTVQA